MEQSSDAIDPNDLLIFARVAELGSFSRAADRLGCPKSTVSRRVAGLETQLGERLLQRTTRRQQLTDFGQQLLEHARQVALEVEAVALLREQRQAAPSGRLRVSMPSDFANLFLPWHRAYLYFFERALRDRVPTLAQPWWDWTAPAPTGQPM